MFAGQTSKRWVRIDNYTEHNIYYDVIVTKFEAIFTHKQLNRSTTHQRAH